MSTLKELSVLYAKKQPKQVDYLTEEAPILNIIPWEPASHGLWNAYEEVTSVTGASFVNLDEALPEIGTDSELKKFDLGIMGGIMECGEDKANMYGGKEAYFAKKLPTVLRESGMSAETNILYQNIRKYAIDNDMATEPDATTAGDIHYSILAIRYIMGETAGLYSPDGFAQGAMMNAEPINGGNLYKNDNGVLVYGLRLKAYFGFQIANPNTVAAIVNIDADNLPTAAQIDDLIASVRGTPGSSFLYMHERCKSKLGYKGNYLQMTVSDADVNRVIASWNGIPIITSYNFLPGTEPLVTL
jgi:hypothetical protein